MSGNDSSFRPSAGVQEEILPTSANGFHQSHFIGYPSLEDLHSMFKGKIDCDVIELIWHESHENGTAALEMLTEMSSPVSTPTATPGPSWSSLLSNNSKPFTEPPRNLKPPSSDRESKSLTKHISDRIQRLERIVILMRGVPGSGKTYLANLMKDNGVVLSTDDFFINHRGQYVYNPSLLSEAHDWNKRRAEREMKARVNPVIIDNTNLEAWEMEPYVCLALRFVLIILFHIVCRGYNYLL